MPVLYALISAFSFGTSDYVGGKLSRTQDPARVTATSQLLAFFVYLALAIIIPGKFSAESFFLGAISGVSTVVGLNFFYAALAEGVVGVVASVTALITATTPALWSFLYKGEPVHTLFLAGAMLAALAIILLAMPKKLEDAEENTEQSTGQMSLSAWLKTICGGLVLAVSLIFMSKTSQSSGCWPLVGVGTSAVICSLIIARIKTGGFFIARSYKNELLTMMLCMGAAYWAQLYAARSGALAIASVVGALYPAPTILLAHFVDNEKMNRTQTIGAVCALVAVVLIALS